MEVALLDQFDGVIFDLDGTLIDSMWIWSSIDADFFQKYHLEAEVPDHFYEGMEGMSFTEVAQYFLDLFPSLTQTKEELMQEWHTMAYDRYVTQVPLKPGAKELLTLLQTKRKKIGIATSNSMALTTDTLNALNVRAYFDVIHSSCEVASGKPSPDVYLLTAEGLGLSPENCLVFEDVPKGIQAGKNAGMKVCAIDDDFSRSQREKIRSLADYFAHDFFEVIQGTYQIL